MIQNTHYSQRSEMSVHKFVSIILCAAILQHSQGLPVVVPQEEPLETSTNEVLPRLQNNKGEEGDRFEGDIRLRPGEDPYNILHSYRHRVVKRRIMRDSDDETGDRALTTGANGRSNRLWPNNIIPYEYKPDLDRNLRILFAEAREGWEQATNNCLQFVPKTENHTDYLYFTDEEGCSSYVGRKGGRQEVSITRRCDNKGHAMHEIGHALGLWHEHSRPDRDNYIRIIWENIKENRQLNFGLISQEEFRSIPDVGYDLESIMHYGPYAFSVNRNTNRTIEVLVNLPSCAKELGQRRELSFKDKLRMSKLYQCTARATQLEEEGPSCNLSMPLPTPTPSTPSTTPTPTSSTTQQPSATASPRPSRIESGSVISIQFDIGDDPYAVHCPNPVKGCYKESLRTGFFQLTTSTRLEQQFEIHLPTSRKNPRIKSGDKVVFRSVHRPTRWFDCSSEDDCTITECQNNAADPSNSSYITDCGDHLFRIFAVGRNAGTAVRTSDQIQFKHVNDSSYLNCLGKKCALVENTCTSGGDSCLPQKFMLEKIQ